MRQVPKFSASGYAYGQHHNAPDSIAFKYADDDERQLVRGVFMDKKAKRTCSICGWGVHGFWSVTAGQMKFTLCPVHFDLFSEGAKFYLSEVRAILKNQLGW